MRTKNKTLSWNVLYYNWNAHKIIEYNIFRPEFITDLHKKYKKHEITSREDVKQFIVRYSSYHYWGRREYEIQVGDLYAKPEDCEKIDIHRQVMLNIERLTDYVINELSIKFTKTPKEDSNEESISED